MPNSREMCAGDASADRANQASREAVSRPRQRVSGPGFGSAFDFERFLEYKMLLLGGIRVQLGGAKGNRREFEGAGAAAMAGETLFAAAGFGDHILSASL